jgi:hypothetical protein
MRASAKHLVHETLSQRLILKNNFFHYVLQYLVLVSFAAGHVLSDKSLDKFSSPGLNYGLSLFILYVLLNRILRCACLP